MQRRNFLQSLLGFGVAAHTLDIEKPGQKLISIPAPMPRPADVELLDRMLALLHRTSAHELASGNPLFKISPAAANLLAPPGMMDTPDRHCCGVPIIVDHTLPLDQIELHTTLGAHAMAITYGRILASHGRSRQTLNQTLRNRIRL